MNARSLLAQILRRIASGPERVGTLVGGRGGVGAMAQRVAEAAVRCGVSIQTWYHVEHVRGGRIIWADDFHNLVTNVGLEHIIRRVIVGQTLPALNGASSTNGRSYPDGRRTARVWTTGTTIAVGDLVQPVAPGANGRVFICRVAGTTHAVTEPTWVTTAGADTVDNTVTWMEASLWYVGLKGTGTIAAGDTMASHAGWSEVTSFTGDRKAFNPAAPTSGSTDNSSSVAAFAITGSVTVAGAFLVDLPIAGGSIGALYGAGDFSSSRSLINGDTLNVTLTTSVS